MKPINRIKSYFSHRKRMKEQREWLKDLQDSGVCVCPLCITNAIAVSTMALLSVACPKAMKEIAEKTPEMDTLQVFLGAKLKMHLNAMQDIQHHQAHEEIEEALRAKR